MTKPQVIVQNLPCIYGNLPNINVINGNEISTYYTSYDYHGELNVKSSMVITR